MTQITVDYLLKNIEFMQNQIIAYQGTIQFAESLIQYLQQSNEMTLDEFAEIVGGEGSTAEINPVQDKGRESD